MTILLAAGERVPVDAPRDRGAIRISIVSLVSGESAPQPGGAGIDCCRPARST